MSSSRLTYAVILFFSGFAVIAGTIALVYCIAVVFDKLSCFNSSGYVLTPEEIEERRTASDLTRRAGLAGILSSERTRVFRHYFEKHAIGYKDPVKEKEKGDDYEDDDDVEAQKNASVVEVESIPTEQTITEIEAIPCDGNIAENTKKERDEGVEMEEEDGRTCSICLTEYGMC